MKTDAKHSPDPERDAVSSFPPVDGSINSLIGFRHRIAGELEREI